MKKNLIPILLFVMFMPFMVSAKEYCKIVSGNGKDIGSEIACGTEHFYVIDSNEDEIKMLAKYNLLTGTTIEKIKIEKEEENTITDEQYCYNLAISKDGIVRNDNYYNQEGYCFIQTKMDEISGNYYIPEGSAHDSFYEMCSEYLESTIDMEKYDYSITGMSVLSSHKYECRYEINQRYIIQDESAISAHWDEDGNFLYPQVGDVSLRGEFYDNSDKVYSDFFIDENSSSKYDGYFYDMMIGEYKIKNILNRYNSYLDKLGIETKNIDLMTLDDINNIIKKNNKSIPFKDWYDATKTAQPPRMEFAWLNEYVSQRDSFLYNSTYWIRSGYDRIDNYFGLNNVIFVDSYGGVCGAGLEITPYQVQSGSCERYTLVKSDNNIGCGIRPVVTIPNELQYLIKTETDKNGSIEVVENSLGGETIQFKVSAKKGYKLGSIVIKTDSGEEVEFSEGEITKNDDGTFSINKNKFTMPFENVTIQAKFELENILKNPETGDKVLFIILILVVSIGIGTFIYKKKESRYNI